MIGGGTDVDLDTFESGVANDTPGLLISRTDVRLLKSVLKAKTHIF